MTSDAKVYLVCATLGRVGEVERLFSSLARQTHRSFTVALVDQNPDGRLDALVGREERFDVLHLRAPAKGCSWARNIGLSLAEGDVVAFPDDDCWYEPEVLQRVTGFFAARPEVDVLTGMARDEKNDPVGRWDEKAGAVTRANVWGRGITFAMFFRAAAARKTGFFDADLGVGSGTPFGSGEETDYLIRALDAGFRCWYDPGLVVRHPNKKYTDVGIGRAFSYGAGMGCVLRRRRCAPRQVGRMLARPLVGAALYGALGRWRRARYQFLTFSGRLWGFLAGGDTLEARIGRSPRERAT